MKRIALQVHMGPLIVGFVGHDRREVLLELFDVAPGALKEELQRRLCRLHHHRHRERRAEG
jgi:hypothetical protein